MRQGPRQTAGNTRRPTMAKTVSPLPLQGRCGRERKAMSQTGIMVKLDQDMKKAFEETCAANSRP